jgi:type VI secretion system secreted protein VgrG
MQQENITFGIEGKEISHFTTIELHQSINNHHKFAIKVPHTVIEKPLAYTIENARKWMGKTVHIVLEDKNNFLGIITNIQFAQQDDQVGNQIIVSGYSKTILLESGKKLHSWEDTSLQEMIREIIKTAAQEQLQNDIVPEYTSKISYQTQYLETDFEYIKRLAKQYNEWLYYDGEKLFFGKPLSRDKTVNLTFGKDLFKLNIMLEASPVQFSAYTYNDDMNKLYQAQTNTEIEGLSRLGNEVFESSQKLYATASFEYGNLATGYDIYLEQNLKKRQESAMAEANYITATSRNTQLKTGTFISIDAREEMSVNTAHLSGLDVTKTNYRNQEIGQYIITEITHQVTDTNEYSNRFKALPASVKRLPEPEIALPQAQIQQAKVVDNNDPKNQGRVRVKMLWQQVRGGRTPWLRILTPDAGSSEAVPGNRGLVTIPEAGDDVMLAFRYNDPNRPFVLGSVFNGTTAKGGGAQNHMTSLSTKSGNAIKLNDNEGSMYLTDQGGANMKFDGAGNSITNAHTSSTINVGGKKGEAPQSFLKMDADGNIVLEGKTSIKLKVGEHLLSIDNEGLVQINGKDLKHTATESFDLQAKKVNQNAEGDNFKINSNQNVILSGGIEVKIK